VSAFHWTLFLALLGCAKKPAVPNISDIDPALSAVPTVAEFQVGAGDTISINVWRQSDLSMEIRIAPDGTISFPMVGTMQVSGLTHGQIRDQLTTAIADYIEDPQVAVNIVELQNQKVTVIGEVNTPAVLQLNNQLSIVEALAMTGGIKPESRTDNVLIVRGGLNNEAQLFTVDVRAIYGEGRLDQLVYLQRGDIVVVPTRTITNVARYFRDIQSIMAPFVAGSAVYRNAISGGAQGTSSVLE
jgi:polysaccharide biosynthesis/export protein